MAQPEHCGFANKISAPAQGLGLNAARRLDHIANQAATVEQIDLEAGIILGNADLGLQGGGQPMGDRVIAEFAEGSGVEFD
jgi:hypothetical protein